MMDWIFWPFFALSMGILGIFAILVLVFWIWMIIDAAKRNFRNNVEKIIWIIAVVLGGWIGALVYFIVIKSINTKGLAKK